MKKTFILLLFFCIVPMIGNAQQEITKDKCLTTTKWSYYSRHGANSWSNCTAGDPTNLVLLGATHTCCGTHFSVKTDRHFVSDDSWTWNRFTSGFPGANSAGEECVHAHIETQTGSTVWGTKMGSFSCKRYENRNYGDDGVVIEDTSWADTGGTGADDDDLFD